MGPKLRNISSTLDREFDGDVEVEEIKDNFSEDEGEDLEFDEDIVHEVGCRMDEDCACGLE